MKNRRNECEKDKKLENKVIFVEIAIKTNELIISSFFMKDDLFDENSILIDCLMKKFSSITMIDINVTEYAFVNKSIAQKIYDVMSIELIKLMKKRVIKAYDDKKDQIIIYVIYSNLIIQNYTKNLIFMLITKLEQQTIILDKS